MPPEATGPHSPVDDPSFASVDGKTPGDKPEASAERVRFNAETELPSPASFCRGLAVVGCTLLIKHVWDLSHVASGLLIVSAACWVENIDRALYSIISCATPLLMALHLALTGRMISLSELASFVPISLLYIGIAMSVCLHRYFSHKAFETSRPVQFVLGVIACLAYQGGPLWWAAMHIEHHQNCDKPADPHSAKQRGFLYAFVGWMANPLNYEVEKMDSQMRFLDKSLLVPEMFLIEKFNPAPPLVLCCIANYYFGYTTMCWCFLGPMLSCRMITLLFNIEFHPSNNQKRCKAVDNSRLLAVLVGESRHEDHHRRPRRARRLDLDLPWWLTLSWMQASGLIWACK
jgi:stearoyl-CoA desaturase (delta-9 desaturase)